MTTITTGTTGPKAWKIALVAAAAGLATLVVVTLPLSSSDTTDQPATDVLQTVTDDGPAAVTGPNAGNPEQAPTGFGGPTQAPTPAAVPDQSTIDLLVPSITQEFLDGPTSSVGSEGVTRVDPAAAAAVGLNPGAIDEIIGGTTRALPAPDNFEARWAAFADSQAVTQTTQEADGQSSYTESDDALVRGVSPGAGQSSYTEADDALVRGESSVAGQDAFIEAVKNDALASYYAGEPNSTSAVDARWEALAQAYENGTISSYYLPAVVSEEPHVPAANNQIR